MIVLATIQCVCVCEALKLGRLSSPTRCGLILPLVRSPPSLFKAVPGSSSTQVVRSMAERYSKISHGVIPQLERLRRAIDVVTDVNGDVDLPFSFAITSGISRFDYLFPDLQTADGLLPESPNMRGLLMNLGLTMMDSSNEYSPNSTIPSAYTYFGQFVDHDITFEAKSDDIVKLSDWDFRVLNQEEIRTKLVNGRTPGLDLDNVYYKPAPRNCSRMELGYVSQFPDNIP